jgi:hypothetical protein
MARVLASEPGRGLVRAAWYSICDAADICQMLLVSLLTGGAAMAVGCALTSLVLWLGRAVRDAVVRAGKRRASASVGAIRPMA